MALFQTNQKGIAAIETACFAVVIAAIGLVVFSLSSAMLVRRSLDATISSALSMASGTLFIGSINSDGAMTYSFDIDKASTLANKILNSSKNSLSSDSFVDKLPQKIEISLYQVSIDPYSGKGLGILGQEAKLESGQLSVPSSVMEKLSINQEKQIAQDQDTMTPSIYAEPVSSVLFDSNNSSNANYVEVTPMVAVCVYVADSSVKVSKILESSFPEGTVGSCMSSKVRRFI